MTKEDIKAKYAIEDTKPDPVIEQKQVAPIRNELAQKKRQAMNRGLDDREHHFNPRRQDQYEDDEDEDGEEESYDDDFIDDRGQEKADDDDEGDEEGEEEDDDYEASIGVPQQDDDEEDFQMKRPGYKRENNMREEIEEERSTPVAQSRPKVQKQTRKPRADDDESLDNFLDEDA